MAELPYLTASLPGTGGVLRSRDDDFVVDEQPAYLPSGAGDHVMVRLEKRGLTTPQAVQAIARAVGCGERDIGVAGMKDRHAVTRQWISLPPPITPEAALAISLDGITILEAARHGNKLRTGHVTANRFVLRVRDAVADAVPRARAILDELVRAGAPNWYGEQRFGRDGDNAARGRTIVMTGQRGRDRRMDRLMVSSLQSQLFNDWLRARMTDGLYRTVLAGDLLRKMSGGQFWCDDPATDQARLDAGELVITGPMFGDSMRRPPDGTPAAEREDAILAAADVPRDAFAKVKQIAEGTRRDASIAVTEVQVVAEGDVLVIEMTLPGGAYATAVMREVMKLVAQP